MRGTYRLTIIALCVLFATGCTGPAGPSGYFAPTTPTNEPTLLPGATVTAPAPAVRQPGQPGGPPSPVPATVPSQNINPSASLPVTPYVNPDTAPGSTGYIPASRNQPPVYPGYLPPSPPLAPAYSGYQPGPTPAYGEPGYTPYPTSTTGSLVLSEIVFRRYSDQNFGIDYPSTWTMTRGSYVQFSSPDGRLAFTAEVNTFLPGFTGDFRLNPDISFVQDAVSHEFPRYDPRNIVYDYRNSMLRSVPVTIYSVRLPDGSVSYTRYIMVTLHHVYQFTFSSDSATFDQAAQLRDYMFSTLSVSDSS